MKSEFIFFFLVSLVLFLFCSCSDNNNPVTTDHPDIVSETDQSTKPPVTSEDSVEQNTTVTSISEESQTVPPESEPVTDPFVTTAPPVIEIKEYDYSKPVPESVPGGLEWFDDAIFIGDSRTQGFYLFSGILNAQYIMFAGMDAMKFFTYEFPFNGSNMTAEQALKTLTGHYSKVYISLGLNELGWSYVNVFHDKMAEIVQCVKGIFPDADIYLQTVMPVSKTRSQSVSYESLQNVDIFNGQIIKVAKEAKVYFIDVDSVFRDAEGYMPENYVSDGVHLLKEPCVIWRDYLLNHRVVK